jgi:hypothetical protein
MLLAMDFRQLMDSKRIIRSKCAGIAKGGLRSTIGKDHTLFIDYKDENGYHVWDHGSRILMNNIGNM